MNVVLRNYKKGDYSQLKDNLQLAGMYYDVKVFDKPHTLVCGTL